MEFYVMIYKLMFKVLRSVRLFFFLVIASIQQGYNNLIKVRVNTFILLPKISVYLKKNTVVLNFVFIKNQFPPKY